MDLATLKGYATTPASVQLKWGATDLGTFNVPGWVMVIGYYAYTGGWDKVNALVHQYLL